ncbi:MAG: ABC transporter permease [Anaerolineales bacterium]
MTTIWRKVLADFWSNKTRTFLMVLTITLGVFSVGFVGNLGAMLNRDMDADFNSSNPAHAKIYVSGLDEEWVRALRKVPGVKDTEGRTQVIAQLVKPNGEKTPIQFEAPKSFDAIRLNLLKPVNLPNGNLPIPDWKEVVFDNSAAVLGYKAGDIVEVELANGDTRKLTFKAYVHDVNSLSYGLTGAVAAYVTSNTILWLGGPKDYNEMLFSVSENETDTQHVTDIAHTITNRFEKSNEISNWQISVSSPGHHFAWPTAQGVIFILSALGWMTVALSVFLIVNTIVALMTQHVRQIGIMRAIGGSTWQIFSMYLSLVLIFGVLALIISIPFANWAAYQICIFLAGLMNYNIGPMTYHAGTVITQIIVAFLVPVAAALAPLLNGLRVSVREALTNYGIGNVPMKETQEKVHLDFFPRPVLVSLRNAVRKKARLVLTLCVLVIGGAIFIAVLNLWGTFDQVTRDIQGYFLADINFVFTGSHYLDDVKSIVMKNPGVVGVEGWTSTSAEVLSADGKTSNEVSFVAPPSNSTLIKPLMTGGRWLTPLDKNAVVIGNHLLKIRPDLKVGDWITIKIQNQEMKWQIVGTYLLTGNISPPSIYTNYEYLSQVMHQVGKVSSLRLITSQHDVNTQKSISSQLEEAFRHKNIPVDSIQQGAVWLAQQKSSTDVLIYFMLVMAILIAFVGGLGLTGMMSINVMERTREIGVMRAIGAADMDIQMIVVAEGLIVGVVSWLLAVLFSIPITYLLNYGVGMAIVQEPLSATFNWSGSLIWLIGILLIAALASAVPAWRASRLTVRDTLVYE